MQKRVGEKYVSEEVMQCFWWVVVDLFYFVLFFSGGGLEVACLSPFGLGHVNSGVVIQKITMSTVQLSSNKEKYL